MNGNRILLAIAAICMVLTGCSRFGRGPEAVFARMDSAQEQYYTAAKFDEDTLMGRDDAVNRQKIRAMIGAYQMLPDNFAEDQIHTPLALASIADSHSRMGEYKTTIRLYEELMEKYPRYPYLHAKAELKIGEALERRGDPKAAKAHYKRCIDSFQYDKNDGIQTIVALCKSRYYPPAIPGKPAR